MYEVPRAHKPPERDPSPRWSLVLLCIVVLCLCLCLSILLVSRPLGRF